MQQGRYECPGCNRRNTEIIRTDEISNYKRVECRDCGNEFRRYTGRECTNCGSRNTKTRRRSVPPHQRTYEECQECGNTFNHR